MEKQQLDDNIFSNFCNSFYNFSFEDLTVL